MTLPEHEYSNIFNDREKGEPEIPHDKEDDLGPLNRYDEYDEYEEEHAPL